MRTERGNFEFYENNWDLYQVGNADVRFTSEQATAIARGGALNKFSLTDAQIATQASIIELSLQNRGNYTLYPLWDIRLKLDRSYNGATNIHASVWADTGEISSMQMV